MSYICQDCGEESEKDWCDECEKLLSCDCKNQTYARFKDLIYDCEDGERTVTIRIHHCETCGEISHIE